jgi:hypothetical protein
MNKPFFSVVSSVFIVSLLTVGCSSPSDDADSDDSGGGTSGASGSSTSGASGTSGTSGASTNGGASGTSSTTGGSGATTTGGASGTGATATGGASTGGASTGGTGGGSGGCDAACARVVGAACGTTTQAECVEGCSSLVTSCPAEVPAYTECLSNPANAITCDTTAMAAQIAGCDDVVRDLNVCGVCVPSTADEACGTCSRGSCCMALQTYVGSADIDVFDACVTPCTDSACVDACTTASPIAGAAYEALGDCQIGSCGEECICGANADDTPCIACLRVGCCAELVPYVAAEDVGEFATCIEPCVDQACVDICISDFPEAGNAYNTLIGCAEISCLDECSS